MEAIFEQVNLLLNEKWLKDIKEFASQKISPLTKEWTGIFLTAQELMQKLSFKELIVNDEGDFTVYLSAQKIFSDHQIQVEGNISTGIKSAYL